VRNERRALARHAAEVREHFHSSIDFEVGFDTSQRSYNNVSSTSCGYCKSTPTYREDRARCRCQQVRVTRGGFLPALGFRTHSQRPAASNPALLTLAAQFHGGGGRFDHGL
jgi:hypothetical protein